MKSTHTSYNFIWPSSEAVSSIWESGEKQRLRTDIAWPSSVCATLPAATSKIFIIPSIAPLAIYLPSGLCKSWTMTMKDLRNVHVQYMRNCSARGTTTTTYVCNTQRELSVLWIQDHLWLCRFYTIQWNFSFVWAWYNVFAIWWKCYRPQIDRTQRRLVQQLSRFGTPNTQSWVQWTACNGTAIITNCHWDYTQWVAR